MAILSLSLLRPELIPLQTTRQCGHLKFKNFQNFSKYPESKAMKVKYIFPSSHVKAVEVNGTSSGELLSSSEAIREGSLSSQPLGVVCKTYKALQTIHKEAS